MTMHISNLLLYIIVGFFAILLFLNLIQVFVNVFVGKKSSKAPTKEEEEDPFVAEVRSDIETEVKPHLTSLEGMYKKSDSKAESFGAFVFSVFKDKFASHIKKDEKLVEEEICKCCSAYENAECKESFCLEGSGLACPQ
jgi:hypothetical protein